MDKIFSADLIKKGGGLLVALATLYVLYKVLTNDLPHIERAILRQADIQQETNKVLIEQTEVLSGLKVLIEQSIK